MRRTATCFRQELSTFVSAIHDETGVGCTVVLPALPVGRAPVFEGVWPLQPVLQHLADKWDEQKKALADRARSTGAKVRRIAFVRNTTDDEFHDCVGDASASYWAVDGIHPNDEGYRIWGEHIGQGIVRQALLAAAH